MKFSSDNRGVSDVLGSILLVAITVAMMVGLSIVVLSINGPEDQVHASLRFTATPGTGGWGSGDETVTLIHGGGEPIAASQMFIVVSIASVASTFDAADMDGGFSDGELTIGEKWSRTFTIGQNDTVETTAIFGQKQLLVLSTIRSAPSLLSCGGDVTGPAVQAWQQTPPDVTDLTVGNVTVTATFSDDCSGVNDAVTPFLEYRINGGAWTLGGPLSLIGASQWSGSIVDPTWSLHADELLEYRIVNVTDNAGNVATSAIRSDLIAAFDPTQYVVSFVERSGSVIDFANAQSDGGAEATLSESSGVITLLGTTATGSGVTNPSNAAGNPDDAWAILPGNNDQVTVSGFDTSGQSGAITKVEIVFEGHSTQAPINDEIDLLVDAGSGFQTVDGSFVPNPVVDALHRVDVTNLVGTWSWNDVANMEVRALYDRNLADDGIDFYVDAMFVEVTSASANDLEVEFQFPTIVAGTTHTLELAYQVSDDTFTVEVWNGTAWNARGLTLNSPVPISWSYVLTAQEASSSPLIRFVDTSSAAPVGSLMIDYARVVST